MDILPEALTGLAELSTYILLTLYSYLADVRHANPGDCGAAIRLYSERRELTGSRPGADLWIN